MLIKAKSSNSKLKTSVEDINAVTIDVLSTVKEEINTSPDISIVIDDATTEEPVNNVVLDIQDTSGNGIQDTSGNGIE